LRVDATNQIKSTTLLSLKRKNNKTNDNDNNKVSVILYFTNTNTNTIKEISNSIIDNQRIYSIDKKKYGRAIFIEIISDIIGFPRGDSFSYYISQRAVQSITQSTPKNLFQTISFSAGTHSIIEVRDNAIKKLIEYEKQLTQISKNIKELDKEINIDQQAFQLLLTRTDIKKSIKSNAIKLKDTEETYRQIKSLCSLESLR